MVATDGDVLVGINTNYGDTAKISNSCINGPDICDLFVSWPLCVRGRGIYKANGCAERNDEWGAFEDWDGARWDVLYCDWYQDYLLSWGWTSWVGLGVAGDVGCASDVFGIIKSIYWTLSSDIS